MRRRKLWIALVGVVVLLVGEVASAAVPLFRGLETVRVVLDGREIQTDVPGVILEGRTVLPVRALAEALGLKVSWDGATRTVSLERRVPPADRRGIGGVTDPVPLNRLGLPNGMVLTIEEIGGDIEDKASDSPRTAAVIVNATLSNPTREALPLKDKEMTAWLLPLDQPNPDNVELNPCPPGWYWTKTPYGNVCTPGPGVAVNPLSPWASWTERRQVQDRPRAGDGVPSRPALGSVDTAKGGGLPDHLVPGGSMRIRIVFQIPLRESGLPNNIVFGLVGHTIGIGIPGCKWILVNPPHPWPKKLFCPPPPMD